jgi:hypothetical protein
MAMASPTPRSSLTLLDGLQIGSPRTTQPAEHEEDDPTSRQRFLPPQPMHGDEACYDKLRGVTRLLGTSVLLVPPMTLVCAHPESKLLSVGPGARLVVTMTAEVIQRLRPVQ